MRLKFTRFLIRLLMRLLTHTELHGIENLPASGNFIIASNHLGLVDAFIPFYFLNNNNLVVLVGEKWEKVALMRWLGHQLNFIFVDRFNPDLKAIRKVIERMRAGEVLVITPEGTRSKIGDLLEGKPGVSYLAAKLSFPILPVGDQRHVRSNFLRPVEALPPPSHQHQCRAKFYLPRLPSEGQSRDEALKFDTDEIMCRIAALIPPEQRGFYAEHPRLKELLGN